MKFKAIRSLAGIITFCVGVACAMAWSWYFAPPKPRQYTFYSPLVPMRSEGTPVCLRKLDLRLGDSFEQVKGQLDLAPDPNGPNQNFSFGSGRDADYFSALNQ